MRRICIGCFLFVFLIVSVKASAQVQFSGWLSSFNTFKLNNRFSLHFDGQLRSTDKLEQVGTILLRPGLNFHLNKSLTVTTGYTLNLARRNVSGLSALLPEHRIWQQALLTQKVKRVAVSHRFRFEERFLPRPTVEDQEIAINGFDQAFRFRYFVRSIFPLVSGSSFSKGTYFALQNEVFLNTGDKTYVNGKTFDQNRFYSAIGYRFPGKMDVEAGYLNQYTNTRTSFVNNHVVQVAVYKRL